MPIYAKPRGPNGKLYLYEQWSEYRPGRTPKTHSRYLGPADGFEERQDRAMASAERQAAQVDAYQRAEFGETGAERQAREAKAAEFSAPDFLGETAAPQTDQNNSHNEGTESASEGDTSAEGQGQ